MLTAAVDAEYAMAIDETIQPSLHRVKPSLFALVVAFCGASMAAAQEDVPTLAVLKTQYAESIQPLLQKYCVHVLVNVKEFIFVN